MNSIFKISQMILSIPFLVSGPLALAQDPAPAAQPNAPLIGIRAAVESARSKNPLYRETKEQMVQAELQVPITRANILPVVSATGTAQYQKAAANGNQVLFGGDPYNSYGAGLKVTQPLFVVGSLSAIESSKKSYEISKLNSEISERDLTNNVIQSYYQLVLNNLNVQTLLRQEKIVKESLSTASQRERTGRGQLLDVLQVKTQIALLQAQIAAARNQVEVSAATLANYLGEFQRQQFRVIGSLDAPPIEVIDKQVNLGKYHLPELEKNILSLAQIEDQKQILLGQQLPKLMANGSYGYTSYKKSDIFDDTSLAWMVGLELDIPIFSGFSYIYQKRSLLSQQSQLEIDKTNVENQLTLQQVSSRKNLESAQQSMISGEEALKLAIASSNEARRQYRLATIDFLQLLTVEQSYVTAESTLNQNKFNYIQALANYFVASGQDLNQLIGFLERGI